MIACIHARVATVITGLVLTACGGTQELLSEPLAAPQAAATTRYHVIYSFGTGYDGQKPKAGLIDLDGMLYGTTYGGGKYLAGTIFSMTLSGKEALLHSFGYGSDGANPSASLLAVKGLLYGTTENGGPPEVGTVFSISKSGSEKVLHRFKGYYYQGHTYGDGAHPVASLIDVDGELYGTTFNGGDDTQCHDNCGTVYRVSRSGREKVLHSFALFNDGAEPAGSLIGVDGTLYGTTEAGGSSSYGPGTVFSISTTSVENVLYVFQGAVGAVPLAGLIKVNGTLYGTTGYGGLYDGAAFSITTIGGSPTLLHSFGAGSDGSRPAAPLLNVHGTLYGTTELGGAYGKGTVFKMSLSGKEKVLHSFGYGADGATPLAGLIDVDGTLYGTTSAGGANGNGTVFAYTLPR